MRDELPERLRVIAEEYRPDSERMWERVAAGMSDPGLVAAKPIRQRFRVPHLAIATGVAVVLIAAIVVFGYRPGPETLRPPVASPPTTVEIPESTVEATEPEEQRGRPASVDELDYADVRGAIHGSSNAWWSQTDLIVTTETPITELTVELHLLSRSDLEHFDSWTTADHYFAEPAVFEDGGYLVYQWTLIAGETLEPGEYTLAGQHDHQSGTRDFRGDYFIFDAVAASGSGVIVGEIAGRDFGADD